MFCGPGARLGRAGHTTPSCGSDYAYSRGKIAPDLASPEERAALPPQCWRMAWKNPANGRVALYLASHAYAIEGMEQPAAQKLLADLIDAATGVLPELFLRADKRARGGRAKVGRPRGLLQKISFSRNPLTDESTLRVLVQAPDVHSHARQMEHSAGGCRPQDGLSNW